ncbi:MAG: cell division protein FtsZ [Erysipelotrichaceae bacterium]
MDDLKFEQVAKIKVYGIGGGGCNAVNRMVHEGVQGVEFYVANTDKQILIGSPVENKIAMGEGLGAGANPEIGRLAAQESEAEIRESMKGADMIFITAGLGGGTGTGAAPLFAKIAKELGALTVGIVTKPFKFEGPKRMVSAENGLAELRQYVDSLIIISNNNLLEVVGRKPLVEAFQAADNVLRQAVQTITDLIAVPSLINLDFADIRTVMANQGSALIGIGMAEGENKAELAAAKAIESPLLEAKIEGTKNAIINITGGESLTLFDAEDAANYIREKTGNELDVIYGVSINDKLDDQVIVTIIATGFDEEREREILKTNRVYDKPLNSTNTQNSAANNSNGDDLQIKQPVHVEKPSYEDEDLDENGIIPNFFKR